MNAFINTIDNELISWTDVLAEGDRMGKFQWSLKCVKYIYFSVNYSSNPYDHPCRVKTGALQNLFVYKQVAPNLPKTDHL